MKKKVISLMLISAMLMGTLSGCGGRSKDDETDTSKTDKMTKKYENYFENVDESVDKDTNYVSLTYSISSNSETDTEETTEASDKTIADISKNIEKVTVPFTDKSKNMIFNLTTEDNSNSLFGVIDDVMYVSQKSTDNSNNVAYKMSVDDINKAIKEKGTDSDASVTTTSEAFSSLSDALSSLGLYSTSDAYVYKETVEDADKKYDVITTDNGRNTVTVSNDETESDTETDSMVSAIYTCYINTDTKLPEKFSTNITRDDKKITINCDVEYLKDISLDGIDSYGDTDYDTFSPILTQNMMTTTFGLMYYLPQTYLEINNAETSKDIDSEDGTESIDEDFSQDDGTYAAETIDGSEVNDTTATE